MKNNSIFVKALDLFQPANVYHFCSFFKFQVDKPDIYTKKNEFNVQNPGNKTFPNDNDLDLNQDVLNRFRFIKDVPAPIQLQTRSKQNEVVD